MEKDTEQLKHELKKSEDFSNLLNENKEFLIENSVNAYLNQLLEEKETTKAKVIKGSTLNEVTCYQYFDGRRKPSREKIIALAFGFGLDDDEANLMLKKTGYAMLYPKHHWDMVVMFALAKKMTVEEVNELLFEQHLATLGDSV